MKKSMKREPAQLARVEAERQEELRWRSKEKAAVRESRKQRRPESPRRDEEPLLFRLMEAFAY